MLTDRNSTEKLSMRKLSENEMWMLIVTLCRDPLQKSINVGSWQRRRAILWADSKIKNGRTPNVITRSRRRRGDLLIGHNTLHK